MAFAQPMMLLFFGLFVPVILLYLLKQRRRRVTVSTLFFWDQILRDEQSVTSWTRLRKLLSLLLQLLVVALLTLALSRPLWSGTLGGARRVVLFVDASASMTTVEDGQTRFDKARAQARDVVEGLSLGDSLMLVRVADSAEILSPFTNQRKHLIDLVDAMDVSHSETRFDRALDILHHLPDDPRETHVYVISDGAFPPISFTCPERTQFAYMPVGKAKDNVGITGFQLRPLPGLPRDFEIFFEVSNETEKEITVPYEVRIAGGLIDANEIVLAAGGRETRTVRQFSEEGGEVELVVDFDDAFALDNTAVGVLPSPAPIPVVLVSEGNLFLESALATDEDIGLTLETSTSYDPALIPADAITVFDRWAPPSPPAGNIIYVGAWPESLGIPQSGTLDRPLITDWDREHAVNRHLQLTNVSIASALKISAPDDYTALVTSFDDPIVLFREAPEGNTLVAAFDTTASDFPLRVAFPIMIANAARYMTGRDRSDGWESPAIGSWLSNTDLARYLEGSDGHDPASEPWRIWRPGDEEPSIDDEDSSPDLVHIDRAGLYQAVMQDGHVHGLFGANLASQSESRITPAAEFPVTTETPLPVVTAGLRLGTEPWWFLACLAALLLAGEWALYHRRLVE